MKFIKVAQFFQELEDNSSRNLVTDLLVDFLQRLDPVEVQMFVYLSMGRVAPTFVDAEFNYSEKGIISVLEGTVSLREIDLNIQERRGHLGDIGLVVYEVINTLGSRNEEDSLTITEVYEALWSMINTKGLNSTQLKGDLISKLFSKSTALEGKYIARIVTGKLRLGFSSKTFLDALSGVVHGDKSGRKILDSIYGVDSDLGFISHRVVQLKSTDLGVVATPGVPIRSRLVERVEKFEDVFDRLGGSVIAQPKFDGLRCQVHLGVTLDGSYFSDRVWAKYLQNEEDGTSIGMFGVSTKGVRLFSRNLEDMTAMFPSLVSAVQALPYDSLILDGEVVGWDSDNERYLPFQETMTRKRKHGVAEKDDEVPVRFYIFDILYLDGVELVRLDTTERMKVINSLNIGKSGLIHLAESPVISDIVGLREFFDTSVGLGLEGIVVKNLAGAYLPGVRNHDWIKLKKSMDKSLVDSVDVVVMGYYFGSGKKAEFGMGALLGGVVGEDGGIYTVTKIGTGITDDEWRTISTRLRPLEVVQMPATYNVSKDLFPDVWVSPEIVCSVEADEITRSQVHSACDEGGTGLALRFPRMIEFDRDKGVEDATTEEELQNIFNIKYL